MSAIVNQNIEKAENHVVRWDG